MVTPSSCPSFIHLLTKHTLALSSHQPLRGSLKWLLSIDRPCNVFLFLSSFFPPFPSMYSLIRLFPAFSLVGCCVCHTAWLNDSIFIINPNTCLYLLSRGTSLSLNSLSLFLLVTNVFFTSLALSMLIRSHWLVSRLRVLCVLLHSYIYLCVCIFLSLSLSLSLSLCVVYVCVCVSAISQERKQLYVCFTS